MIKAVKGTRDILPPASAVWNRVEAIGSESPIVDAEVIEMVVELLRRAGLDQGTQHVAGDSVVPDSQVGFHLIVNSVGCTTCRPKFMAALKEKLVTIAPTLCADCQ